MNINDAPVCTCGSNRKNQSINLGDREYQHAEWCPFVIFYEDYIRFHTAGTSAPEPLCGQCNMIIRRYKCVYIAGHAGYHACAVTKDGEVASYAYWRDGQDSPSDTPFFA